MHVIHTVLHSIYSAPKLGQKPHSTISSIWEGSSSSNTVLTGNSYYVLSVFNYTSLTHKGQLLIPPTTFSFVHHSILRLTWSKAEHGIMKIVKKINFHDGFCLPSIIYSTHLCIFFSSSPFPNAT